MFKMKSQPYNLFFYAAILLILASFFIKKNQTVDFHVHDTYYVIGKKDVLLVFALIVFILWILYLLFRIILYSVMMTWIHVMVSLVAVVIIIVFISINKYYDLSGFIKYRGRPYIREYNSNVQILTYSAILLFVAQIVFLINLMAGLIKGYSRPKAN
jgi:heme/copper-type cytochrome/quinol oxidase subunit 1